VNVRESTDKVPSRAELLSSVVDGSSLGVAIYDMSDRPSHIVYANNSFCALVGISREALTDQLLLEVVEEDDRERVKGLRRRALAEGNCPEARFRIRRPNGERSWMCAFAYPLSPRGSSAFWALTLRDVTEEHERGAQVHLLSQAIEASGDFVLITDVTPPSQGGPFNEYLNPAFVAFVGYAPEEVIGKPYSIFFGPRTDERVKVHIAESVEELQPVAHELLLRRKDGEHAWVEFTGRLIRDEKGVPQHWMAVGRDVTARRRAQSQTSQLLAAIEGIEIPIAIYAVGEDSDIVTAYENARSAAQADSRLRRTLTDKSDPERARRFEALKAGQTIRIKAGGDDSAFLEARAVFDDAGRMEAILTIEHVV
jgi:PAS domain S-box-containing protein